MDEPEAGRLMAETHDELMRRIGYSALDRDSPPARNATEQKLTCKSCANSWLRVFWNVVRPEYVECPSCGDAVSVP